MGCNREAARSHQLMESPSRPSTLQLLTAGAGRVTQASVCWMQERAADVLEIKNSTEYGGSERKAGGRRCEHSMFPALVLPCGCPSWALGVAATCSSDVCASLIGSVSSSLLASVRRGPHAEDLDAGCWMLACLLAGWLACLLACLLA